MKKVAPYHYLNTREYADALERTKRNLVLGLQEEPQLVPMCRTISGEAGEGRIFYDGSILFHIAGGIINGSQRFNYISCADVNPRSISFVSDEDAAEMMELACLQTNTAQPVNSLSGYICKDYFISQGWSLHNVFSFCYEYVMNCSGMAFGLDYEAGDVLAAPDFRKHEHIATSDVSHVRLGSRS